MGKSIKRLIILSSLIFLLSGCGTLALNPAFSYLSYLKSAGDAASYMATGKTIADHVISAALEKDCAIVRAIKNEKICVDLKKRNNLKTDGKYVVVNRLEVVQ